MDNSRYLPSNVFKYCPVCGKKSFVASSAKSLQCSHCSFQLFTNPAAAVAAIITDHKNNILFTVRNREPAMGTLDLLGGFVDPEETAEQALKREIKEELNIELTDYYFFRSYWNHYVYGGLLYYTSDLVFVCSVTDFSKLTPDDEIASVVFKPFAEINPNDIGLTSIKQAIKDFRLAKQNRLLR